MATLRCLLQKRICWPRAIAVSKSLRNLPHVIVLADVAAGGDYLPLVGLAEELPLHGVRTTLAATRRIRTQQARFVQLPKWAEFSPSWRRAERRWSECCAKKIARSRHDIRVVVSSDAMLRVAVGLKRRLSLPICLLNTTYDYFSDAADLSRATRSYFARRSVLVEEASLILHASERSFEGRHAETSPRHKWIGSIFWEPSSFVPSCFGGSADRWALVSTSLAPLPNDEGIAEVINTALRATAMRAVWTTKARIGRSKNVVNIRRFASHSKILPHVQVCICHAGYGTVMKALAHGIPLVLFPTARDQIGISKRAKCCGVAVVVPASNLSVNTARSAIEEVVSNPMFARNARKWAKQFRERNSVKAAAFHLRRLAEAI